MTAHAGGFDAGAQHLQLAPCGIARFACAKGFDATLQFTDVAQDFDFGGHEARVLEDAINHAQVFRNHCVVTEVERPARPGQVVQFAASDGLGDALLGDQVEQEHGRSVNGER